MILNKIATTFFTLIIYTPILLADVKVKGYYKANGTYVQPHYRSNPDRNFNNNWSTAGNINPHTGEYGTKNYTPSTIKDINAPYTPTYPSIPSKIEQNLSSSNDTLKKPSHISDNYSVQNSKYQISFNNVPSLEELEQESKFQSSNRLKNLGYVGDTSKLSNMEMLELEARLRSSKQLKNLGYSGDTSTLSNVEMLDLETKLRTHQRVKSLDY